MTKIYKNVVLTFSY